MCPPYVLAAVQAFSLQHGTTQIRFSVPLNVPILADTGCESTAGIIHPEMVALIETHVGHTLPRQTSASIVTTRQQLQPISLVTNGAHPTSSQHQTPRRATQGIRAVV